MGRRERGAAAVRRACSRLVTGELIVVVAGGAAGADAAAAESEKPETLDFFNWLSGDQATPSKN